MQIRPSCCPVGMNIAPLAKTGLSTIVFNLAKLSLNKIKNISLYKKLSLKVVFEQSKVV
jgi:hypothetical protein